MTEEKQAWLGDKITNRPRRDSQTYNTIVGGKSAAAKQLERNLTKDALQRGLYAREQPTEEVLRAEQVAPRLRQATVALERQMNKDKVSHLLEQRSDLHDLETHGIAQSAAVAPALQRSQKELEKNLARSNLYHGLTGRPSIEELEERGIYSAINSEEEEESYGEPHDDGEGYYEEEEEYFVGEGDEQHYEQEEEGAVYQRRSKNFHLTRILLKFVASMAEAGEISLAQKGYLKDLVVDQDRTILAVAETFDAENDLHDFKDSLTRLAVRDDN
jgi:hypothetical protein